MMSLMLGCPTGWHYYNGYCYYTSPTPTDRADLHKARGICHAMGAELVSIIDQAEMDFVKNIS